MKIREILNEVGQLEKIEVGRELDEREKERKENLNR